MILKCWTWKLPSGRTVESMKFWLYEVGGICWRESENNSHLIDLCWVWIGRIKGGESENFYEEILKRICKSIKKYTLLKLLLLPIIFWAQCIMYLLSQRTLYPTSGEVIWIYDMYLVLSHHVCHYYTYVATSI